MNHHHAVPFHLLRDVPALACGEPGEGNLIVQGDNLVALKALLPYYAGRVKCIVIDPPYNTGEQLWTYDDQVSSPEIRAWLGRTVGRDAEDLARHDKWLCMMYPRLQLLMRFLSDDGFVFICIDDVELYRLKLLMDEIMGASRYLGTFVWKSRRNLDSRHKSNVSVDHEYVVAYRGPWAVLRGAEKDLEKYDNPDGDSRGAWMSDNLVGLATKERRRNLHYDLIDPASGINYGCPEKGWRYSPETMAQKICEGRVLWPRSPKGRPRHKKFLADLQSEYAGFSSIIDCGNTNEGTEEVGGIMGAAPFIFPKPRSLIEALIEQATDSNSLVLDSFSGSGTTAHAVLGLNKRDGGNRRFILVEMDEKIAREVTAERVRRVARGYTNAKGAAVAGLGGGFRFCELGEPLYDEAGHIRASVKFSELARHIYFAETGEPLPRERVTNTPLLGVHKGRAVCLLYNGILKDKSPEGGNALTHDSLALLREAAAGHAFERLVVYGTSRRLSPARLLREGITFKQIPYTLRTA